MYFQIQNIEKLRLSNIVANNITDANKFAAELYPDYAYIVEITHQEFHRKLVYGLDYAFAPAYKNPKLGDSFTPNITEPNDTYILPTIVAVAVILAAAVILQ